MNHAQENYFVAAAEALSFARAARELDVPRHVVISAVKQLEADLGHDLFDYSATTTTLTPEGEALLAKKQVERAKHAAAAEASRPAPGGKAKAKPGKRRPPKGPSRAKKGR
ncbi:MAG: LysR family transcriptional regulator [Aeromicrobium sp.]